MELIEVKTRVISLLKKYKYAVLILVAGIALMLLPFNNSQLPESNVPDEKNVDIVSLHQQLEQVLSFVHGVGDVKVMLCEAYGEETIYHSDEDYTLSEQSESRRIECVTVVDSQRNEHALIKQIIPPKYQGAIVICQGADDPGVRLSVTNAVCKVTGLGADKIAVLKMK